MKRKYSKILCFLLVLSMCVGLMPVSAMAATTTGFSNFKKTKTYEEGKFSDVSPSDWYCSNVKTAYELGLMIGRSEDTFGVSSNVTIAETVTVAARLHSIYSGDNKTFNQGTPWYQVYADYLTGKHLINLNGLDMNAVATRAQYAGIISAAFPDDGFEAINNVADNSIPDVKSGDLNAEAIYKLYRAGILTGNDSQGTFSPDSDVRRCEVAAVATRMAEPELRKTIQLGDFYTVSFVLNYGSEGTYQTSSVEKGKTVAAPTNPSRNGYTFAGWYTSATGGSRFDFNSIISENVTLYAHWNAVSSGGSGGSGGGGGGYHPQPAPTYYTVTFDSNGGSDVPSQSVSSGSKATEPQAPTKTGYDFAGWYRDISLTTAYDFNTVITSSIILYAKWTLTSDNRVVTFETNGGSDVASQIVKAGEKAIQPDNPFREGYTFASWYNDAAFNSVYDFDLPVNDNLTLYANWIAVEGEEDTVIETFESVDVYSISDLSVDQSANLATANVSAADNCALVVRFIDEEVYFSEEYPNNKVYIDDGTLYASHVVPAQTDMESVEATISGSLPDYYVVEAVLLDADGNELCDPYTNIEKTVRHQQFEAKTVYDFSDENLVLNFDEDTTDNFGVLAEDVKIMTAASISHEWLDDPEDVYIVGNDVYVITLPSDELNKGDKVFISDDDGDYIFMVADVTESEGVYTVTPAKADDEEMGFNLSDFYQFLKVDMVVDMESAPEEDDNSSNTQGELQSLSFSGDGNGVQSAVVMRSNRLAGNQDAHLMGWNVKQIKKSGSAETSLSLNPITFETTHFRATGKVGGKLSAKIDIEWDVIIFGKDYFKCDFSYTTDLNANLNVSAKWGTENNDQLKEQLKNLKEEKELTLGKVMIPIGVTGLDAFADIKLNIEWKINAGLDIQGHIKTTHGFKYNNIDGKQTIDKKETTWSVDVKGHAEISFGPRPSVGVEFLGGAVSAELGCFFGVKVEGNAVIPVFQGGSSRHACHLCVDGKADAVIRVSAKLKYKITDHFKGTPIDLTIVNIEKPLFKFYVSLLNERDSKFGGHVSIGKGACPNKEYKITFNAEDADGNPVAVGIEISNASTGAVRNTVQSGDSTYLPPENYKAKANIGGVDTEKTFNVSDAAKTVTISAKSGDGHVHGSVVDADSKSAIDGATIEAYAYTTLVATTKSNAQGTYSFALGEGDYKLLVKADGYTDSTQYFSIKHGENKYLDSMLMSVNNKDVIMGGIFGTIKDATTGQPVTDVTVRISQGWGNENATGTYIVEKKTNGSGVYEYKKWSLFGVDFGLNAGNYTVTISKDGYITTSFNVAVVAGEDLEFNSSITPVGSDDVFRIVLRWSAQPSDLDSHLNGTYNGGSDHIYFSAMRGQYSNLDVDDTDSYGPETITIPNISDYTGNVYYSVHDYSNASSTSSNALSSSGANVEVSKGGQILQTFYVPANRNGTVWNVFYITPAGVVVPVNNFEYIQEPENVKGSTGP